MIVTLLAVFLCAFSYGQEPSSPGDLEKAKKSEEVDERVVQMLERAVLEAGSLRLPQNRAVIYAMAADLYWKIDDKRARELFRNAAAELIAFNFEADRERRESDNVMMQMFGMTEGPRLEILPLVAKRDAELALDLLLQTRSERLNADMLRASAPDARQSTGTSFDPERQRVRAEIALEQQFAVLAADENPERAVKLIKDSLTKGISMNVLQLLNKLNKKDEKKAAELAGDLIKKLVDTDLARNEEDLRVAVQFLQVSFRPATASKDKPFAFSEAQIKDLANKISATLLQPSNSMSQALLLNQTMPMLEKYVPERVALLKQRQAEMQGRLPVEFASMQRQQRLWDANTPASEIIEQLPKLQNDFERAGAYQALAGKVGQMTDEAQARKLIDQIPDEGARTNAIEQFEAGRISRSASAGRLDEARQMIGNLTKKKTQIQRLVALAMDFHKKGGEKEVAIANDLMQNARTLAGDRFETGDEIGDVMELVRGYAAVDPEKAFQLFEPVVDVLNEHLNASAVIARFNPQSTAFRKGELALKINGNSWDMPVFRYISQMQTLGKLDLDKMNVLADRFQRNDARAIVKLYILQGHLGIEKAQPAMSSGVNIIFN